MILAALALSGLMQFQAAPANDFQTTTAMQQIAGTSNYAKYVNYSPRINMRSPVSGSVLIAQAIRAGKLRVPYAIGRQVSPDNLTCSPVPCTTPNVQASNGGAPANETPITVDPNNPKHLLSGANDYNCSAVEGFYASSNGGTTWNHTCMNVLPGASGDGDPGVGYDTAHRAFITAIDAIGSGSVIAFEKSTNNGTTWSAPAQAIVGISPWTFVDKPWTQIDDTPTSPGKDNIYISTTEFDPNSNSIIAVGHSTDHGSTWHNVKVDSAVFPAIDQFSDLAIGKDGTVYVTWMRCSATGPTGDCGGTTSTIMFAKSTDGGVSWSAPVAIANAPLAPDSCGAFYGCLPNTSERVSNVPAIDVDRSSGNFANRLYTILYKWNGIRLLVYVSHSGNGGASWSTPVRVAPGASNDEFFPWLTTSSNGTVGATWLDRRLDPSNVNYDAFASTSTNGGVSFAAGARLTTVSSNPFNDGFGSGFMGDYTGDIWKGNILFGSWADTRNGSTAQDEIGGLKI